MSRAKSALDQKDKVIRGQLILILALLALLANAHISVLNVPKEYTFHTPPDLSLGGHARLGEVPQVSAFNFAFTMFGGVNTWIESGSTEFPQALNNYQHFFSNAFLSSLRTVATREESNNRGRSRQFKWEPKATPALEQNNGFIVESKGNNTYYVTFAARVIDKIQNYEIKNQVMVYHLIVGPKLVPRHLNPWQMEVVGQFAASERL